MTKKLIALILVCVALSLWVPMIRSQNYQNNWLLTILQLAVGNGSINASQTLSGTYFSQGGQYVNGGSFYWRDVAGSMINVTANPFGNQNQPPGFMIGLTNSGCPGATWGSGVSVTGMLLVYDKVGDVVYSAQNTQVTTNTGFCSNITSNPISNVPGAFAYQLATCTGVGCGATLSNFVILSKATALSSANYGPFTVTTQKFVSSTIGPAVVPADTQGLIVPNVNLHIGTNQFVTSVPWVTGSYSLLTGDTAQGTQIQLAANYPDTGHQLGEPWGGLVAGGAGVGTHSETVAFGLYDYCGGTAQMVSISPVHSFPPFTAGAGTLNVLNPGIPAAPMPWSPSSTFRGSTATCAGERIVATNASSSKILVLRATNVGTSGVGTVFDLAGNGGTCVFASLTVGQTCIENSSITWKIEAIWSQRVPGNTYTVGSTTTGSFWDTTASNLGVWTLSFAGATASCAASGTANGSIIPPNANIGDTFTDNTCTWIFTGGNAVSGISGLINPAFGVFSADCVPNQIVGPLGKKQCSGGGASGTPYLAGLHISTAGISGVESDWSGCTDVSKVFSSSAIKGNCDAVNGTNNGQAQTFSAITGTGGGAAIPNQLAAGSIVSAACPTTIIATCNIAATPTYIIAVFNSPMGPVTQTVETGFASFTAGGSITGPAPINPPDNATGYMIYAGQGNLSSGNESMQVPDGINFQCTTYILSPLYGEECDLSAGWQMNNIQTQTKQFTALSKFTVHNAGEYLLSKGGPALLPQYPGGAYGVQFSHMLLEGAKTLNQPEPGLWHVFNQSAEEASIDTDVVVSDALGGGEFCFDTGCQNSGMGYIHTVGATSDSTIDFLVLNVTAFHSDLDWSCGGGIGNFFLSRSGIMVKVDYIRQSPVQEGGIFLDPQCEAVIEGVTAENVGVHLLNRYGRNLDSNNRAAVWGLHCDHLAAYCRGDVIWCAGPAANTCNNIQDDVITPVPTGTLATTSYNVTPTAMYVRDTAPTGGVGGLGPASPNGLYINSDQTNGVIQTGGKLVSKRYTVDNATTLVVGDFNITTGPSWGSTAALTVTNVTSKDQSFQVTITEGGISQAANPTIILTFHDGTFTSVPNFNCNLDSSTTDVIADVLTHATATALTVTYAATPTTNKVVVVNCTGSGT